MLHYCRKTSQAACMPESNSTLLDLQIRLNNSYAFVNYTHLIFDHFQTISCKIVEPLRKNKVFCPPLPPIAMLMGNNCDFTVGNQRFATFPTDFNISKGGRGMQCSKKRIFGMGQQFCNWL